MSFYMNISSYEDKKLVASSCYQGGGDVEGPSC